MLFVGTSIIHPSTEGVFLLCNILDLLIYSLYDMFEGLSLELKEVEETSGAEITSFRFNLHDGTSYELIYGCYGVKTGNLKSSTGNFEYFTSADISSYWSNTDLEAVPVEESELPN